MGQIQVEKNAGGIEGLCVITPTVHGDDRGYFMETYNLNDMKEAGLIWTLFRIISQVPARVFCADFIIRKIFHRENSSVLSVARYSMLPSIYEKAVKPTANGMDLNYQRKTKNSFIFQRDLPMVISFLVNGLNFVINVPTSIIRGMMADLFGMILQSVSHGRTSQENIRAMALLPVTT